ncbi:Sepiapterin reductase [Trichinella pseudospiralis]|uniref:Sepiapterin reductase n=1 Tax=Trichinella pseudospiralis TaxID=6337 RepID=A0A0V1EZS5_TRIPS|nr:Sepiapterin reductase [Trichinella pseudospiralis]
MHCNTNKYASIQLDHESEERNILKAALSGYHQSIYDFKLNCLEADLCRIIMSLLGKKTLCLIAGASRGIGRAISLAIGSCLAEDSDIILMSRDKSALENVKREILRKSPGVFVYICQCDLSKPSQETFMDCLRPLMNLRPNNHYDVSMVIHNAASIGPIDRPALKLMNSEELTNYFDLNLTSTILLNNAFFQLCEKDFSTERVCVNITSGAAYHAIKSLHLYSAAKAARDAFFRVLATEEPGIRVLSFNPGPVVTDMQVEIYSRTFDSDIKMWSRDGMQNQTFQTCDYVANKLMEYLRENTFQSGLFYDAKDQLYIMQKQNQKLASEAKVVLAWDRTRDHLRVKQM